MTAFDEGDRLLRKRASQAQLLLRQLQPEAERPADPALPNVIHGPIIAIAPYPAITRVERT